jgi:spermidine/putrescine transport system substrate-binding protein
MKQLALLAASLFLALPALAAKDELHLYNWNNYLPPETLKRFEAFCKCTVVQTYYSDTEELLAKLSAGATGYDMYVSTSHALQTLIRSGRLKPIVKLHLPNLRNVDSAYLDTPFDPGNKFSVPNAFGTTIMGCNDAKAKELGLPIDTWALIFEPRHLEKIKGRVTVLDSADELFAAALIYLGYPANDVDPKHWDEAAAVIRKAKPYWAAFNASSGIKAGR